MLAYFTGGVGVEAGKYDGAIFEMFGLAVVYDRVSHDGRYRCGLFPVCGLGVRFSSRAGGSAEGMDGEPGMVCEEGDKTLSDCPRGTNNADLDSWTICYLAHDGSVGVRRR